MSKTTKLRIGIFGDRAVGKTTYLTTLHGLLANNKYSNMEVRYEDSNTVRYLKSNFQTLLTEDNVEATIGEYNVNFELWFSKNGQEHHFEIEMKDFAGEKTNVETNEINSVVEFLSTCDAILYLYSIPDKIDNPAEQDLFDVNTILTQLAKREEIGRKIKKPFVLLLTKCDEITSEDSREADTLDEYNALIKNTVLKECDFLVSELQRFSNNFTVVAVSSFLALHHFKNNRSDKMWQYESTGESVEFPIIDVAYPISYILNKCVKRDTIWDSVLGLFKK